MATKTTAPVVTYWWDAFYGDDHWFIEVRDTDRVQLDNSVDNDELHRLSRYKRSKRIELRRALQRAYPGAHVICLDD